VIDRNQISKQIATLNETPLSQHIKLLFKQEKSVQESVLILCSLLYWAEKNLPDLDWNWMQEVTGAAAQAVNTNPEKLYRILDTPGMEDAETLEEAAMLCLGQVADVIIPDDSPAFRYQ
jgi:hypothetical protein